jgi:hypothetical protein
MTRIVIFGALAAWVAACGSMSSSPTAPTPQPTPSPAGSVATGTLTGTWSGTGSDSFSPELVTWVINQSGTSLSGTAELKAVDPLDGTCGSCHKVKHGTLTGTLSGSTLTVSMTFPAGGDVPAPICDANLSATGTIIDRRITATYTGTDSCEGIYANGLLDLAKN